MRDLKKIWIHRKQILEGITNAIFKKTYIEKIANERLEICEQCELIDTTGNKCLIPGTQPCCSACGCKLYLKVRSLSSHCEHPEEPLWVAVLDDDEQDKLYNEIEYDPDRE